MLCPKIEIHNPKRGTESRVGRASWYRYYAGFSTNFVRDALRFASPKPPARILDPWNGSGTTSEIAVCHGFEALGFDLNPAMVIVAKARLLDPALQTDLARTLNQLLAKSAQIDGSEPDEPLKTWLTPGTAASFRRFERAIQAVLIDAGGPKALFKCATLSHVSNLAAFFYVATFRALRQLLSPFRCANPTWVKEPLTTDYRIKLAERRFHQMLREEVNKMAICSTWASTNQVTRCAATIEKAASAALPVAGGSVDAVISSPPYCTRIDYVKKTGPELALLGARGDGLRKLRDRMIGTPTIHRTTPKAEEAWGETCLEAIHTIAHHNSYASESYYWKTYVQYFKGLHDSLREIDRALKSTGTCTLVVQDSYYKDLRIDLAKVIDEMAQGLRWATIARADFPTARTIVGVNTRAIQNGNPKLATETVLVFRKEV